MNYSEIESLVQLRDNLNTATEQINKKIEQFETDLQTLGMGVQLWVKIPESEIAIGYIKFNSKWKICLKFNSVGDTQEVIIKELAACDRGLRYFGYKYIDLLVPAIKETAEKMLIKMNKVLGIE